MSPPSKFFHICCLACKVQVFRPYSNTPGFHLWFLVISAALVVITLYIVWRPYGVGTRPYGVGTCSGFVVLMSSVPDLCSPCIIIIIFVLKKGFDSTAAFRINLLLLPPPPPPPPPQKKKEKRKKSFSIRRNYMKEFKKTAWDDNGVCMAIRQES